ncbi:MAG: hypothetical protein Q4B28_00815 [bacterium]|nr:hypothetical protein [bacterium]
MINKSQTLLLRDHSSFEVTKHLLRQQGNQQTLCLHHGDFSTSILAYFLAKKPNQIASDHSSFILLNSSPITPLSRIKHLSSSLLKQDTSFVFFPCDLGLDQDFWTPFLNTNLAVFRWDEHSLEETLSYIQKSEA